MPSTEQFALKRPTLGGFALGKGRVVIVQRELVQRPHGHLLEGFFVFGSIRLPRGDYFILNRNLPARYNSRLLTRNQKREINTSPVFGSVKKIPDLIDAASILLCPNRHQLLYDQFWIGILARLCA